MPKQIQPPKRQLTVGIMLDMSGSSFELAEDLKPTLIGLTKLPNIRMNILGYGSRVVEILTLDSKNAIKDINKNYANAIRLMGGPGDALPFLSDLLLDGPKLDVLIISGDFFFAPKDAQKISEICPHIIGIVPSDMADSKLQNQELWDNRLSPLKVIPFDPKNIYSKLRRLLLSNEFAPPKIQNIEF